MTNDEIKYIGKEGYKFIKEFHKNGYIYIQIKHDYCGKIYETRKESFIKRGQRCSCQRRHGAAINTIDDVQTFIDNKFGKDKYKVLSEKYFGRKAPIVLKDMSTGMISEIPAFDRILDKRLLTLKNYFELSNKTKHYVDLLDKKCIDLFGHKKFEVLDYCGSNWYTDKKSTFECLRCGEIFERKASDILRTCRCPLCENESPKNLTINIVRQEFLNADPDYELLSNEYISTHDLLTVKHKKCGTIYQVSRTNFLAGRRCPHCIHSKTEKHIEALLEESSVPYEYQKRFDGLKNMPFDFYIPSINTAIEYDGEFHYLNIHGDDELKRQQAADKTKNTFCKDNSINLIRIPYWEKDKIDDIISNILK